MSITDFGQPMGMRLHKNIRWVKKAELILREKTEKRYAGLFKSNTGNAAKELRFALGVGIMQAEYGFSDEETALLIRENPYPKYFCGHDSYVDSKPPFGPSGIA